MSATNAVPFSKIHLHRKMSKVLPRKLRGLCNGTSAALIIISLLLVAALASCGSSVPPVTVGKGGFRVAGKGQDPAEIYSDEYARFSANALRIYYAIRSNPPNHQAAAGYVRQIIDGLKIMHDLLEAEPATKLAGHIQKYEAIYGLLITNRYNATTISDLDRCAAEIRSGFNPSEVRLKEFAQPEARTSTEPGVSLWITYEAWDRTQQQLEQNWVNAEDCQNEYKKVIESLEAMKKSLPEQEHPRIQTCIDSYLDTYNKTNGLKEPPEGSTREETLNDLRAPASIIRQFYNPDKNK